MGKQYLGPKLEVFSNNAEITAIVNDKGFVQSLALNVQKSLKGRGQLGRTLVASRTEFLPSSILLLAFDVSAVQLVRILKRRYLNRIQLSFPLSHQVWAVLCEQTPLLQ